MYPHLIFPCCAIFHRKSNFKFDASRNVKIATHRLFKTRFSNSRFTANGKNKERYTSDFWMSLLITWGPARKSRRKKI